MSTKSTIKTTCFHCGEDCPNDRHRIEDKVFCCSGCKTVYELIQENELTCYYDFATTPGSAQKNYTTKRFDYLDEPGIRDRLIEFSDGKRASATFFIPYIHCSSCIWLLENLYRLDEHILQSRVDFPRREVTISWEVSERKLSDIVALLAKIGYEPRLSLDSLEEDHTQQSSTSFYLKLGLAGFAFGNIMLFSLPEYFSPELLETGLKRFFSILNLFLAIPVILYSASDYYKSAWYILKEKRINMDVPITIGMIALFSRSLIEIIYDLGPGYFDSFTGLVFFLLIGKWFQQKTYDTLSFDRDYKSYFPISVTTIEEGVEHTIPLQELKTGDAILARNQELIPADALLESNFCEIDYSFVTGEHDPVPKHKGEQIYAGGRVIGSSAQFRVLRPITQSYLTRLWNHSIFRNDEKESSSIEFSDRFSAWFTGGVMMIALVTFFWWFPTSWVTAINASTAVLIIACPCALALSVPFTMGSIQKIFARHQFFVKNPITIEKMAKVNAAVFDKTGTLSESSSFDIRFRGDDTAVTMFGTLFGELASHSTHPLSKGLSDFLSGPPHSITEFHEVSGKGIRGVVEGHRLSLGSPSFLIEQGISVSQVSDEKYPTVHISADDIYLGYFVFKPVYRQGIKEMMLKLSSFMPSLHLLSGDNDRETSTLEALFNGLSLHFKFNQTPDKKLHYVSNLKEQGYSISMLGDGLNDAGALKSADVGIAIVDDIHSFTPASNAILKGDQLPYLHRYFGLAKGSLTIVYASYTISLLYNVVGLTFAIQGLLSPLFSAILMPLSSISVILFTVSSSYLLARKQGF